MKKHEMLFALNEVKLKGIFAWMFYIAIFPSFIEGAVILYYDIIWIWNWLF